MRSFATMLTALLTSALFVGPPVAAAANECAGEIITFGLGDATPYATIYYVIVGPTPDNAYGYLESNGAPGLQRGYFNDAPGIFNANDPCKESYDPDVMWY